MFVFYFGSIIRSNRVLHNPVIGVQGFEPRTFTL